MEKGTRRRLPRSERARRAAEVAALHDGVAHRRDLRLVGVSRADVRTEVAAGRWSTAGVHTVVIGTSEVDGVARLWQAVWETGSGAVLDGVSALSASGLSGFTPERIDVAIPANHHTRPIKGVRVHRRRALGPLRGAGLPRATTEPATIRAAQWARTDRTAVLIICLVVQQRLVRPEHLFSTWLATRGGPRRKLLDAAMRDVCDGAHSLGELDFSGLCRARGLPAPTRQTVCRGPEGRVYLDVLWEDIGLVVEVDGGTTLSPSPRSTTHFARTKSRCRTRLCCASPCWVSGSQLMPSWIRLLELTPC